MATQRRWLSGPKSGPNQRIGIAWFKSDDYVQMLDALRAPHDLPWDFTRWLEKSQGKERYWKSLNHLVVRIWIVPEEFLAWCVSSAREPNGQSLDWYVQRLTLGEGYLRGDKEKRGY